VFLHSWPLMTAYFTLLSPAVLVDAAEVKRLARHGCLDIHRVDWPFCALATDGFRMLCRYEANDAESIRLVLRQQGYSGARVLPVKPWPAGPERKDCLGPCVVVEWACEPPDAAAAHTLPERLLETLTRSGAAFEIYPHPDGTSGICVVGGDEAEHVTARIAQTGVTVNSTWRASAMDPRPESLFENTVAQAAPGPP